MRTVTFSDAEVARTVNDGFVATWINRNPKFHNCERDTEREIAATSSEGYATPNFSTHFMTPDRQVLTFVEGYLSPTLFLPQAEFAGVLAAAVTDESRSFRKDRWQAFERLHHDRELHCRRERRKVGVAGVREVPGGGGVRTASVRRGELVSVWSAQEGIHRAFRRDARKRHPCLLEEAVRRRAEAISFTEE